MSKKLIKFALKVIGSLVAFAMIYSVMSFIKASDSVNLNVVAFANSVEVSWTVPEGVISQDLRYSTSPLTITNFENGNEVNNLPEVKIGEKQTIKIGNLKENVTYYVAYKYSKIDKEKSDQNIFVGKKFQNVESKVADFETAAMADDYQNTKSIVNVVDADVVPVTNDSSASGVFIKSDNVYKNSYSFASVKTVDIDVTAPEKVRDLTFSSKSNEIIVSWTAPTDKDLDTYVIKYNTTPITESSWSADGDFKNVPVGIPGEKQSVTIDGLTQGKVYYFAIMAKDFSGNLSAMSTIKTGTEGAVVLQFQPTNTSVTVMWHTPSNAVTHEMRYSTTLLSQENYATGILVSNMPALLKNELQLTTINQLQPKLNYYFAYKYSDTSGNVNYSFGNVVTAIEDITPPAMVTNFNLLAQNNIVLASWTSPTDVDLAGFHIRYSTSPITTTNFSSATPVNNSPAGIPGASQSVVVNGLNSNTLYYIGIQAVDVAGNESSLVVKSIITGNNGNFDLAVSPSSNSISVIWYTPLFATNHELRFSTQRIDETNFNSAQLVSNMPTFNPGSIQSTTINQLTPNTTYYIGYKFYLGLNNARYFFVSTQTLQNDKTSPSPVLNLSLNSSENNITMNWITPDEADLAGFHVRYATFELRDSNFHTGTPAVNTPIAVSGANQSMTIDGLNSSTNYYVGIQVIGQSGNESFVVVNSISTTSGGNGGGGGSSSGGGGGSIGGGSILYGAFIGPFSVKVANDNVQTFSRNVDLKFDCGGSVKSMAISNLADLNGAQVVDYKQTYPWTLSEGEGFKTVYARCYGFNGEQSPIISDSIELVKGDGNYLTSPTQNGNIINNNGQVLGVKIYPDHTLVRTPDLKVYQIVNNGKKVRVFSVFDLYYKFKGQPIENITFAELAQYPDNDKKVLGTKVFSNGTLVRGEDYRVYVIENGTKRYLPTLEDIKAYKNKIIVNVSYTDLAQYPTVETINNRHNNLQVGEGSLIRDEDNNIYVIRNGRRQYIPGLVETFERYANVPIVNVDKSTLAKFPLNGPYPHNGKAYIGLGIYPNNTLIKTPDGKIYLVMDGYGELINMEQLKANYAGKKILNVNEYFAIPSPKPLY